MRIPHLLWACTLSLFVLVGCSSTAPTTASNGSSADKSSGDDKLEKAVKKSEKLDGLFTVYRDTTDGSLHLALSKDQIGQEYIYHSQTVDGVPQAGHFRGNYRDNAVFEIRRYYDRIEFVEKNTNFHFNEDSELSRAADANVSPSVLHVEKIVADNDSLVLIKADNLFLTTALHQVAPSPNPKAPPTRFKLGGQSKSKTKIVDVHNYPANTDVVVDYVFSNPKPLDGGDEAVTDARNVTITMRHSLIEVPDNDFEPRFADPRVGYFSQQKDDQTSTSATPYHDLINRWHLKKKNPDQAVSEPVEPIVWWIENTTPERIRPVIKEAVLTWNDAFEEAGFRNAIQVKVQPDTAEWDAGDIRYNVLRWTSSPSPFFGGYGPSFVNPHTGQILGADVMLEYVFLTNRVSFNKLFDAAGVSGTDAMMGGTPGSCSLGTFLHANTMFGRSALRALGPDPEQNGPSDLDGELTQLMEEGIYYLALHEVGHTLGLTHNMKATQLHGVDDVHDASLTRETGVAGSVMDYPAINVAPPSRSQGQYYTTVPGPYDVWAIQYGYEEASDEELDELLSRSTEPELAFGNDADDMRAPGKAIDPRVMIGDMSSDALSYAEERITLAEEIEGNLLQKYREPGQSWQELRDAYMIVMGQRAQMMTVASRYVGGVYVDRGFIGQEGSESPYTPVALEDQKQAMALLRDHLFAPDAFEAPADLYRHLQPQRRGFEFFEDSEDPKIHEQALQVQSSVLAHLLHPNTVERITDSRLYGNEYPLADYMQELTAAIFEADARGNVNTFRQNLQLAYTNALATVISEKGKQQYDFVTQSAALASLNQIESLLQNKRGVNAETRAHTDHVLLLVNKATSTD